jgi:hypothetical protein
MMDDDSFTDTITEIEEDAWNALKEVVRNMVDKFKLFICNMSLKLNFLASHLDYFPLNLGAVSEVQADQDLKDLE